MAGWKEQLGESVEYVFNEYGTVIGLLCVGFFLGWNFKKYIADKKYVEQINIRLKEKDDLLQEYKELISERLKKVVVPKDDISIFKRLRKFFKSKRP